MKKIFTVFSTFGLCCLLYVSVYAQTCITIAKIDPDEIPNPHLFIGEFRSLSFSFEDSAHHFVPQVTLQVTSGALPPGMLNPVTTYRELLRP